MNQKCITLPCTHDDIQGVIDEVWPTVASARVVDLSDRGPLPLLDGHMGVGFSIRLFGAPLSPPTPDDTARAYAAMEDLLRALEDSGFEVTRDGNKWQPGRLVFGWSACRRAYDTDLLRIRDLPAVHGACMERSERLHRERAERDKKSEARA